MTTISHLISKKQRTQQSQTPSQGVWRKCDSNEIEVGIGLCKGQIPYLDLPKELDEFKLGCFYIPTQYQEEGMVDVHSEDTNIFVKGRCDALNQQQISEISNNIDFQFVL
eukprot:TRINITY_DN16077_c0_g1_i1.p1 TRINITY_DN16077_c0_g1~~TRINITY_DN16077_c0_g1_i1.p1  ORF type:complete len:110 (-),score=28.60 TRINITY_DN16077_c0_g1_i1:52-381(-)